MIRITLDLETNLTLDEASERLWADAARWSTVVKGGGYECRRPGKPSTITPGQRVTVRMLRDDGMAYKEIRHETGISIPTISRIIREVNGE